MSILVVRVTQDGIIFGADRNITKRHTCLDHSYTLEYVSEKSQRPKVLRWPNRKALVGYAGAAGVGDQYTDEWLYDFIGRNQDFDSIDNLAHTLSDEVERQRRKDEGGKAPELLIIHLAGFEERYSYQVPFVYFIRNAWDWDNRIGYSDIRKEYQCNDHFWRYFENTAPSQIKKALSDFIDSHGYPFGFQQGLDLTRFNAHDISLVIVNQLLAQVNEVDRIPLAFQDWVSRVKMSILTNGAYYEAFFLPGNQYVGGGADTVTLRWPID